MPDANDTDSARLIKIQTGLSRVQAILEQHMADGVYHRERLDRHLEQHPSSQKLWGVIIGVGWMATLIVSVAAVIG